MKKIVLTAAILMSALTFAQDTKPTFEKDGNQIKGTFFHEDGKISQEGYYNKEGKLHGKWIAFNQDGQKTALGQYENGVKTGKWFFWKNDQLSEVNYDDNTIASVTTWSNKNDVVVNVNN